MNKSKDTDLEGGLRLRHYIRNIIETSHVGVASAASAFITRSRTHRIGCASQERCRDKMRFVTFRIDETIPGGATVGTRACIRFR